MAELNEQTGGLPLVKGETIAKSGLNVLGNKNVALGMDDSASIRDYLQQMINQRQAYKGSFEHGMDQMRSVLGGTQNEMAQNMQAQRNRELSNDQDVFNMRVNMAQLKTQEDRLLQEKQQKAQQMLMTENAIRAASGLPPLTSLSEMGGQGAQVGGQGAQVGGQGAVAGQGAPAGGYLTATQQAGIRVLSQTNPDEAIKQMLALTKPTDLQRELSFMPVDQRNQFIAAIKGDAAYKPIEVYDPVLGRKIQTTAAEIISKLPIFNSGAPAPVGGPAPAPAPVGGPAPAPAPVGGPAPAPAPVGGPAPAPAPAPRPAPAVATAPSGKVSPAVASILNMPNPNPRSSPSYGEFEAERNKKVLEQQAKEAAVGTAGSTKESEKMGETFAAEQGALRAAVDSAPSNILLANQVMQDVKENKDLFAKLNQPSFGSALAGLMKSGIQIGQFGSISVPGITDFLQQVDPSAKDNPKRLEAWTRIATSMAQINLDYAQRVLKGQGAVSNLERELVERSVGDISRDSARNMMVKMKMLEIASANAQQINDSWENAQKTGLSWQQFKSSPEYKAIKRDQYYNTAKVMQIKNVPKYPGEE